MFGVNGLTRHRAALVPAVLALAASVAHAGVMPTSPEFQVNQYFIAIQQGVTAGSMAQTDQCELIFTWEDGPFSPDGDEWGVFARRFDEFNTPITPDFQVNTYTTYVQFQPVVAASATGEFVIVWEDKYGQDGDEHGVFAQLYDSAGAPNGTEFQVNTTTSDSQWQPSVAMDDDGSFVAVWTQSVSGTGSIGEIHGQRFDPSGALVGTEFHVPACPFTPCNSYGGEPHVDYRGAGRFVVVWQDEILDPYGDYDVLGHMFDATGAPVGTRFLVNTYTTEEQRSPAVAANDNGSFVVVWEATPIAPEIGASVHVFGRRFDAAGTAQGNEFQVNSLQFPYVDLHHRPDVGIHDDGSFVVAWEEADAYYDGDDAAVIARRFSSAGAVVGSEFVVNSYTTFAQGISPTVETDGQGAFVIAWTDGIYSGAGQDGSGYGVFARRYCNDFNNDGTCEACGETDPPLPIDHFDCYAGKIPAKTQANIVDKCDATDYAVRNAVRVCFPANKNGEGVIDPAGHLTKYRLKGPKVAASTVEIRNQFGVFGFKMKRTKHLLVPAAVAPAGGPSPGPPDPGSPIDHYRCIKVKPVIKQPVPDVTAVDSRTTHQLVGLRPLELCLAADKNGEGVKNPEAHLMCYKPKLANATPAEFYQVNDQFAQVSPKVTKLKEFCVPSLVSSK